MTPLTPPTDNLYKFMAISGIVLVFFSFWPYKELHDALNSVAEMREDHAALGIEMEYLAEDLATLTKENGDQDQQAEDSPEIERRANAARERLMSHEITIARMEAKADRMEKLTVELVFLSGLSIVALITGIYLAERGFRLWYERLQKYQDLSVAASVPSEENEPPE